MEEIIFSPLCVLGTLVKDQLTMHVFWIECINIETTTPRRERKVAVSQPDKMEGSDTVVIYLVVVIYS